MSAPTEIPDQSIDSLWQQRQRLLRFWLLCWGALLLATWPLWCPQTDFPSVPLFGPCWTLPAFWQAGVLVGLVSSLVVAFVGLGSRIGTAAILCFSLFALLLVTLNQHRLQPWMYQAIILCWVFAGLPPLAALRCLRWLTISIYFYSALGKLDYQFLHTVGQQFLQTILAFVGVDASLMDWSIGLWLAGLLPCGELAIAVGLSFRCCRRWAACGAIVMHLMILLIVSPWGLGHRPGVWIWNLAMAGNAYLLFFGNVKNTANPCPRPREREARHALRYCGWLRPAVHLIVCGALLLPLSERYGFWDHWLSWALYSPHTSRVDIYVHASAVDHLPAAVGPHVGPPDPLGWCKVAMDRWSLQTVGVPIYPQARFQLAVAIAMVQAPALEGASRVELRGISHRFDGRRSTERLVQSLELRRVADRYWLNALPAKRES